MCHSSKMSRPSEINFGNFIVRKYINVHTKFQVLSSMYVVSHQLLLRNFWSKNGYLALFCLSATYLWHSELQYRDSESKIPSFLRSAREPPRRGRASARYGGIFRFRSWSLLPGGPNSVLVRICTFFMLNHIVQNRFRDVYHYKLLIPRSIDGDRKKFFGRPVGLT